jgi:hypothetical protein
MQMGFEGLEGITRAGLNEQSLIKNKLDLLQAHELQGTVLELTR